LAQHNIQTLGYLPGYSGDPRYNFTRQWDRQICVSFDTVETNQQADFRVLVQCEVPKLYIKFESMVRENYQNFDLILTYDDRLLELPNARKFIPVGVWVDDIVINKTDQISYLMSSKIWTGEHRMRFMILRRVENLKRLGNFDFFMHRSPPYAPSKNLFFSQAKFHITCENQVMTNMFSEKLLDCFRTYTIPIYYGCTNLGEFFDPRGVLAFNTIDEFQRIVDRITPDTYDQMLPYARINYELAKSYWEKSVYQRIEEEIQRDLLKNNSSDLLL